MKHALKFLTMLLMVSALTCWAAPAAAARLASVSGQVDKTEQRDDAEFKLGDHSQVQVQFKIKPLDDGCKLKVLLHRKQANGTWLVVNTILRTSKSTDGSRDITLPAGDYKIEVIGRQAKYDVSVSN